MTTKDHGKKTVRVKVIYTKETEVDVTLQENDEFQRSIDMAQVAEAHILSQDKAYRLGKCDYPVQWNYRDTFFIDHGDFTEHLVMKRVTPASEPERDED